MKADTAVHTGEQFDTRADLVVVTASDSTQYAFDGDELRSSVTLAPPADVLVDMASASGQADVDGDGLVTVDDALRLRPPPPRRRRRAAEPAQVGVRRLADASCWRRPRRRRPRLPRPRRGSSRRAPSRPPHAFRQPAGGSAPSAWSPPLHRVELGRRQLAQGLLADTWIDSDYEAELRLPCCSASPVRGVRRTFLVAYLGGRRHDWRDPWRPPADAYPLPGDSASARRIRPAGSSRRCRSTSC